MLCWIPGFCVFALTLVTAHSASTDDEWLRNIAELRNTGRESFRLRAEIQGGAEQITIDVSCAAPERQCMILRDSFDGVPLMIATDGVVWLYDPIGGQVLKIRAEPSFKAGVDSDKVQFSWGMRADFPDAASYTTIRLDLASILTTLGVRKPANLTIDRAARTVEFADEHRMIKLTVDRNTPPRPTEFSMDHDDGRRRLGVRCTSFIYGAPVPKWHRALDQAALSRHVAVRAVRDASLFPAGVQENIGKVKSLLTGGGMFAIRGIMRDPEERGAFEKHSPVPIDFDELKRNDDALREKWLKALREQELPLPEMPAKSNPK